MKEILKITAVLSVIALIAGGLLGLVYAFCRVDDSEIFAKKIQVAYEADMSSDLSENLERNGDEFQKGTIKGVYRPKDGTNHQIYHAIGYGGYNGNIELLIVVLDGKITKIVKYYSGETPGLGSKATESEFLDKFIGVDLATAERFAVLADGGNVRPVSSATYSSRAVIKAINCTLAFYKEYGLKIAAMPLETLNAEAAI